MKTNRMMPQFFEKYELMELLLKNLKRVGERYLLKKMLPDFSEEEVLDMEFEQHCRYAIKNGAHSIVFFLRLFMFSKV